MKASRGVFLTCLLSLVALGCESVIQELNSITELKNIFSDKAVPLHSLTLLHWFAINVDIDNNNVVQLNFDTKGDFGSHYYGNNEGLLPSAPQGYEFYTVGDMNRPPMNKCPSHQIFPDYVLYPCVVENSSTERNRGRIIVRVHYSDPRTVNQIYLTQQHSEYSQSSGHDPRHTYRISINLLQQLRLFSFTNPRPLRELRVQSDQNIDDNTLNDLINMWGRDQAPLGLLHLIVARPRMWDRSRMCWSNGRWAKTLAAKTACWRDHVDAQVVTGGEGKARIIWGNVTKEKLKDGVAVALFRDQLDQGESLTFKRIRYSDGRYDTTIPLNEGLQVRLHKTKLNSVFINSYFIWTTLKEEICRGDEFKNPHSVPVTAFAQLQLYAKDGKACFRLSIKKECDQWKSDFHHSWVGLYESADKRTTEHLTRQWQWAIKFQQGADSDQFYTFEYCTGTTVAPGLQARFITKRYEEKARTAVWR